MQLIRSSLRTLYLVLSILIVPAILVGSSAAQSSFGSIIGAVSDATGVGVPNATVTAPTSRRPKSGRRHRALQGLSNTLSAFWTVLP